MNKLFLDPVFCIVFSIVLAALLLWIIRFKAGNWILLLFGVTLVLIPFLLNPYHMVYSSHGLMHLSIVYQIMNGSIPPENPLLAGEPLKYPWAHHLLVAWMSRAFSFSPQKIFALLNICSLFLTMIIAYKIAKDLFSNRLAGVFAVLLSIFGITFFNNGPIAEFLHRYFSIPMFIRPTPLAVKFMGMNSNSLGLLFFALFLFSSIHIFSHNAHHRRYYICLFLSVMGIGFFYPIYLPAVVANAVFYCVVTYVIHRRAAWPNILAMIICLLLGAVILTPYLLLIASGRSETAQMGLSLNPYDVINKSLKYSLTVLPVSILLFAKRKPLFALYQTKANEIHILAGTIITTALMYIFIYAPIINEYKYLMLSCFSLGILGSICLQKLWKTQKVISFLLISSFLIPLSQTILSHANADDPYYQKLDHFIEDGIYLKHSDPAGNTMYTWIYRNTHPSAVLIDTQATIPVFGRRQLFVGLDARSDISSQGSGFEGWGISADMILTGVSGNSKKIIDARTKAAARIYSDSGEKLDDDVFFELNRMRGNEIYVVARDVQTQKRLLHDDHFNSVFAFNDLSIFRYRN